MIRIRILVAGISSFPIYPLLFGIYPILALLATNVAQIRASSALRATLVVICILSFTWLVLDVIFRDRHKASLITAWLMVLFFSYGHIYSFLEVHPVFGISFGRHRLLAPIWLFLAGIAAWLLWKKGREVGKLTPGLNLVGLVLVLMPASQWFIYEARLSLAYNPSPSSQVSTDQPIGQSLPPDIYYIILDSYAREDVLSEEFQFSNTNFLNSLREAGFYVADCSQSNYSQTPLVMISVLNLDYLQALGEEFAAGNKFLTSALPYLKHGLVRSFLESRGYTTVAFETGYRFSEIDDAQVYFSPKGKDLSDIDKIQPINGFEAVLIKTYGKIFYTDLVAFGDDQASLVQVEGSKRIHRARVLYTLDKLKSVPLVVQSPKLVIAHIVAPHVPLVFGPDGEYVGNLNFWDKDIYRKAYPGEITYLNKRLLNLIHELLAVSARPPVIILQSDHGYESAPKIQRMLILNAIYLPRGGEEVLYPGISPVNTFRVVLDNYFGAQLPVLADISYHSDYKDPYTYNIIPQGQLGCGK